MIRRDNNHRFALTVWQIILLLFLIGTGFAQQKPKSGIKVGLELSEYLSSETGSYRREPGFTGGLFTGISFISNAKTLVSLGLEADFLRMIHYRPGREYIDANGSTFARMVRDERYVFSFVEAGLLPAISYSIDEQVAVDAHIGPSVGVGTERFSSTTLRTEGDPQQSRFWLIDDDYGKGFRLAACLNIGVSLSYRDVMAEMRYKYTYVGGHPRLNNFKNAYLQVGLVL